MFSVSSELAKAIVSRSQTPFSSLIFGREEKGSGERPINFPFLPVQMQKKKKRSGYTKLSKSSLLASDYAAGCHRSEHTELYVYSYHMYIYTYVYGISVLSMLADSIIVDKVYISHAGGSVCGSVIE